MKRLFFLLLLFAFGCSASALQWEYTSKEVKLQESVQSAELQRGWVVVRCELLDKPSLEGKILASPDQGIEVEIKDKVKGDNGLDFTLIRYTDPVSQERLEGFVYSDFITTKKGQKELVPSGG